MKLFTTIAFSLGMLAIAATPEPLMAQPSRVVCESSNNRMNRCSIDTRGRVRLNRQLSGTSCNGRWRTGRGYVEVTDGCRAEFVSEGRGSNNDDWGWNGGGSNGNRGDRVTCESNNKRTNHRH